MNIPVQEIMTEWEMVDGVFECNHIEVLVEKAEDQDGVMEDIAVCSDCGEDMNAAFDWNEHYDRGDFSGATEGDR